MRTEGYDKSSWEATLELRQNQQTAAETAAEAEEESDEVEVVASSSPAKDKLVELTVRGKGMQQMSFRCVVAAHTGSLAVEHGAQHERNGLGPARP